MHRHLGFWRPLLTGLIHHWLAERICHGRRCCFSLCLRHCERLLFGPTLHGLLCYRLQRGNCRLVLINEEELEALEQRYEVVGVEGWE